MRNLIRLTAISAALALGTAHGQVPVDPFLPQSVAPTAVVAPKPNWYAAPDATPAASTDWLPLPTAETPPAPFHFPTTDPFRDRQVEPASASIPTVAPSDDDIESALPRLASLERSLNGMLQASTGVTYPTIKLNGVFQADFGWVNQDAASMQRYGDIRDGADFRRARLAASGAITEVNNYFMQMDFAFFGRPTFTDLWVEQTDLPLFGNVRVGQWKQPFSLEVVSSFRYTTFVERSVLFQPFTPFRHLGIGFYDRNDALTMTWAASAFAAGQDQFGGSLADTGGIGTAERLTWLPYYDEPSGGRYYTHLGLGHHYSAPNDHLFNFRTVPEMYIGQFVSTVSAPNQQPTPNATFGMPFVLASGILSVRNFNVVGSELLWVHGPWSLQSEGMVNFVDQSNGESLTFFGGYAQLGYFLTGEHRPYDRKAGAIDRIKPFENFFRVRSRDGGVCRGWGAWEVAARLSTLNLKGHYVGTAALPGDLTNGGVLTDVTLGLNWYLNAYTKCQFNYIHSQATNAVGTEAVNNLFDLRVQVDF